MLNGQTDANAIAILDFESIHPYNLLLCIDQWPTTVARIECSIVLDVQNLLDLMSDIGHNTLASRVFKSKWVTNCYDHIALSYRIADAQLNSRCFHGWCGNESQIVPFEDLSVVSANYEVDGQVVGTLGVIGPTRMPYERMIQIVNITSKLISNALSHKTN
jgi:heat-inducible transcriptional repressor